MSNVILFGFKGCGKSYLGRRLAQVLSRPFIDTDEVIMKLHGGLTCREIYKEIGEKQFRALEQKALATLEGVEGSVIALGGGAILDPRYQLKGTHLYLDVEKEVLQERFSAGPLPPFEELYHQRLPLYEKIPGIRIVLKGKSEEQIINEMVKYGQ